MCNVKRSLVRHRTQKNTSALVISHYKPSDNTLSVSCEKCVEGSIKEMKDAN